MCDLHGNTWIGTSWCNILYRQIRPEKARCWLLVAVTVLFISTTAEANTGWLSLSLVRLPYPFYPSPVLAYQEHQKWVVNVAVTYLDSQVSAGYPTQYVIHIPLCRSFQVP